MRMAAGARIKYIKYEVLREGNNAANDVNNV